MAFWRWKFVGKNDELTNERLMSSEQRTYNKNNKTERKKIKRPQRVGEREFQKMCANRQKYNGC